MLIHWEGKYLIPSTPFSSIHVIKKAIQFTLVSCANLGVFFMAVCITRCRGHGSFPLFEKNLGIIISPLVGRRLALGSICVIIKKSPKIPKLFGNKHYRVVYAYNLFPRSTCKGLVEEKKTKTNTRYKLDFLCAEVNGSVFWSKLFYMGTT